jgi:hypothetical protein
VHRESTRCIDIDPKDPGAIFCPGNSNCNIGPADIGPLLLHVGCKQTNPFWDTASGKFEVPPTVYYKLDPNTSGSGTSALHHWLLEAMREVPDEFRINREMWYPQALFRAFHEQYETSLATTVLLLGGQAAGKSVMATMALREETWTGALPGGGIIQRSDYVYVSPSSVGQNREEHFIESMAALQRGSGSLIAETPSLDRNIRALFLRYEADELPTGSAPGSGGLQMFNAQNLRKVFAQTAVAIWGGSGSRSASSRIELPPPISSVVFYDLKGETVDVASGKLIDLAHRLERIAFVISAEDLSLFGGQTGSAQIATRRNSVDVANKLMQRFDSFPKPFSLIVTHIDAVRRKTSPPVWANYWAQHNTAPADYRPITPATERDLLCQVLDMGNNTEKGIGIRLRKRRWPVHFVWTEDIDTGNRYSVGIHNFVYGWCLPGLRAANPGATGR